MNCMYKEILFFFVVGIVFCVHLWGNPDRNSSPEKPGRSKANNQEEESILRSKPVQEQTKPITASAQVIRSKTGFAQQPLENASSTKFENTRAKNFPFAARDASSVNTRAFDRWPAAKGPLPCLEPGDSWKMEQSPAKTGLLFTKAFKCGSSTGSGIHLRIARNLARRRSQFEPYYPICKARFDHVKASKAFATRDKQRSFLWTLVRDPTNRIVSAFFHMRVSRRHVPPTFDNFVSFLTDLTDVDMSSFLSKDFSKQGIHSTSAVYSHYAEMISLQTYESFKENPLKVMNQIVKDYDFIGVTERMDEVAVALSMILDIPLGDVLYLSAKFNGGFDAGGFQNTCHYIVPSVQSTPMKKLFATPQFQSLINWDRQLHQAANTSLDLTIEKLGRREFEMKLAEYKQAQAMAKEMCLEKTVFPCSFDGGKFPKKKTDCIWKDSGCGYKCLDEVATKLELWGEFDAINVTGQEFRG